MDAREKIMAYLGEPGHSQAELAERADVSPQWMSKFLKGEFDLSDVYKAIAVAGAMRTTVEHLMDPRGNWPAPPHRGVDLEEKEMEWVVQGRILERIEEGLALRRLVGHTVASAPSVPAAPPPGTARRVDVETEADRRKAEEETRRRSAGGPGPGRGKTGGDRGA